MRSRIPALLCAALTTHAVLSSASAAEPSTAADDGWAPQEVVITSTRLRPYTAAEAATATRTPTPLQQTPQSIQVLTRTLLEDQELRTLGDALSNISAVSPVGTRETVLVSPQIRGFKAEVYVDGLPAFGTSAVIDPASLVNVERVEVAKGPTSTLFSGGLGAPVGGLINIVSKRPLPTFEASVGLRVGSDAIVNPYVDLNAPLPGDGRVALRITADYENADNAIDSVDLRRGSVYPTLSWQISDATALTIRGQYSTLEQLEYAGLPAELTVTGPLQIDRFRFSGATDAPRTEIENKLLTAVLEHRFSEKLSGTFSLRRFLNRSDEYATFPFAAFYPPLGTNYLLLKGYLPTDIRETTASVGIVATLGPESAQHQLLFGADYDRTAYFGELGIDFFPIGLIDYADRTSDAPFGAPPALTSEQDDRFETRALYVQDQITLGQRWHLLAGLRFTEIDVEQRTTSTRKTHQKTTPRLGATFDLTDGIALFAGYAQGFRGVTNYQNPQPPVPEESESFEAGLKFAARDHGLTGTVSLYQLTRENVPTADPLNPFLQVQTGEQRARGAEVDLIWEPNPSWSVLLAYAYTDAEVTRDAAIPVGNRLTRTPRNGGRLAVRYRFDGALQGLELGGGVRAGSSREITLPNGVATDGYYTIDAQASYQIGRYSLGLSIINLTDRQYFEPYQFLAQSVVAPADPRGVLLNLRARY